MSFGFDSDSQRMQHLIFKKLCATVWYTSNVPENQNSLNTYIYILIDYIAIVTLYQVIGQSNVAARVPWLNKASLEP